jgi:hypothetical protein
MCRESNGMKSEVRNPKAERRPKPETRTNYITIVKGLQELAMGYFGIRHSDFGINL